MSQFVTTRLSLLMRLRDSEDSRAWEDFQSLYAPIIYRFGRRMGLQDADSIDLTQDVLVAVFQAIGSFEYDRQIGRFRGWLKTVAYHAFCALKKRGNRVPTLDGSAAMSVAELETAAKSDARFWDDQYAQRLFDIAAERVRAKIKPTTWEVFVRTALKRQEPQAVANRLGLSVGNVYVAKARVSAQVMDELRELDES